MAYRRALTAIRNNDFKTFQRFLKQQDWTVSSMNWTDYYLLMRAVKFRRNRMVRLLLQKGCRVHKPKKVNSLLHVAVFEKCSTDLIKKLLSQGVKVAEKNAKGETALHLAFVNHANDKLIDLLLDYSLRQGAGNIKDRRSLSILHIACTRTRTDVARQLIQLGSFDINSQVVCDLDVEFAGCTALHLAVKYERVDMAELLLTHNADIYIRDIYGSTPLHLALEHRSTEMIDLLFKYDQRFNNYVNRFGISHFMAACASSDPRVIPNFLKNNGSSASKMVSSQIDDGSVDGFYSNLGYTPLHFAAEFGRIDTAQLLLSRGADCCISTVQGFTSHNLAIGNGHEETSYLLEMHCSEKMLISLLERQCDSGFLDDSSVSFSFVDEPSAEKFEYLIDPSLSR